MKYLSFFISLFLFTSCANMIVPGGGPKDEQAPVILKSVPQHNSTNYRNNSITIEFDEYIRVENLNSELLVSPPLNKIPTHKVKGKKLTLKWEDTLRENTTYTFFFGQSIKDNNEGNILENFTLTFSTGDFIDTGEIKGLIINEFDKEPVKNAFVYLLDKPLYDSSFFPVKAFYITKTNSKGNFNFKGLKTGDYYIVSLDDKNKNKKPDPGESIAFLNEKVSTNDTLPSNLVGFIYNPASRQYFSQFGSLSQNTFYFKFQDQLYTNRENITVYAKNIQDDSLTQIPFIQNDDSILFQFDNSKKSLFKITSNNFILIETDTIESSGFKKNGQFIKAKNKFTSSNDSSFAVQYSKKILSFDTSRIRLTYDTITTPVNVRMDSNDINPYVFYVDYDFEEGKSYSLTLKDSFLLDSDSIYSKRETGIHYQIRKKEKFSRVKLTLQRDSIFDCDLIIILKKGNDNQYFYIERNEEELILENIENGSYNVIIIGDLNKNKIWDAGNVFTLSQSEPVFIMDKTLEIKEAWDFDASIQIFRYLEVNKNTTE